MLGGDAGSSFGVEPEVRVWRRLGVVYINEHRLGVVRGGVESEMLRAYVVIKEPRLIAVFSGAGVHILHVGLLGAGCDRASFFSVVFRVLFSRLLERCNTAPPDFLARESARRREPAAGLRPVLRRVPRLVLHAFVTHSYWLVNGDEIRKDSIHAGAGAEIEQSSEARSNDRGKQNYDN